MKERLDRRRRLKEKQHAKEISKETAQAESAVESEFKPREDKLK